MPNLNKKTVFVVLMIFGLVWVSLKVLLPVSLPFLIGSLLALAAEPMVKRLSRKLPRPAASAIGVAATLLFMIFVIVVLTAITLREFRLLVNALPDLGEAAYGGLRTLERLLLRVADKMPVSIRPLLSQGVTGLFSDGNAIIGQIMQRLPAMATSFLSWVPGSAIALGTGILSGFMVSARYPRIKNWYSQLSPAVGLKRYLPVLQQVRAALFGWLKAQLALIGLCFMIVGTGLLLLRVPYGLVWAFLIALVDAIPILGTGTVLLPWSLICLAQNQSVKALGLLGIYGVAVLSRSIFEPKLVGKQLGLDPLVTLIALYAGFRFWGIGGMLLSPMICVVFTELIRAKA